MASVKYTIRGKNNPSKITLRFIIDKQKDFRKTIPILMNPNYFNNKSGKVRQIAEFKDKKIVQDKLNELEDYIIKKYNESISTGLFINSEWLKKILDEFFNQVEEVDLNYLTNYCNHYVSKLKFKTNEKTGAVGTSRATVTKYTTIKVKIENFEKFKNRRFLLSDVGLDFRQQFLEYLIEKENLSRNTVGRYIKFLKTICLDAQKTGYKVNRELPLIKGFKVEVKKIYLNFKDIEKLQNKQYKEKKHSIARDWLIIGCYIGQRAGDLLQLTKNNISTNKNRSFINVLQQKTKKRVTIPIKKEVKDILNKYEGNFPPAYSKNSASSLAVFNRHIKKTCELAEIDEMVEGSKIDPKTKRKKEDVYAKHELVTSHICRRSFATNFYGTVPTPFLINVTGHSTEREFLNYIGKSPLDYAEQLAEIWN